MKTSDALFAVDMNGQSSPQFGYTSAALPDMDGDSIQDLAVGVPFADFSAGSNRGAFVLIYLTSSGTVKSNLPVQASSTSSSKNLFFTEVLQNDARFGTSITSLKNLDGDSSGIAELAIGAPSSTGHLGAVYIFFNLQSSVVNCGSPTQTGFIISSGDSYFNAERDVTCANGYTGTATSIRCQNTGFWTTSSGCSRDCDATPSQTGYIISAGASSSGSLRTATCATGYAGTAISITCSNGAWSTSSGCMIVSCPASPTQAGYTFSTGDSTYNSNRTVVGCAPGYTGTPTSPISCQSSGSWSSSSGCYPITIYCPTPPANPGYVIMDGAQSVGATRTVSCATGYMGSASSITCQESTSVGGAWTTSSGCTIVSCGTPMASLGYVLGSGGTTYGSAYTMTCASGYQGTALSITCQASGSWTTPSGCSLITTATVCLEPSQAGYSFGSGGTAVNSQRTVSCSSGFSGTATTPVTCQSSGIWTLSSGCNQNCQSPLQTGYSFDSGASTHGAARTAKCDAKYSGTASTIVCYFGVWTPSFGCYPDCESSPSQQGYVIASGTESYGSVRTAVCDSDHAYVTVISSSTSLSTTCQSTGSWSPLTGCALADCGTPSQTGYTFTTVATTYGEESRSESCATGYSGSASRITCQANASWSSSSGCYLSTSFCPSSPSQTGYIIATGTSSLGSMRTVTCAESYWGAATSITCENNSGLGGVWTSSTGCSTYTQNFDVATPKMPKTLKKSESPVFSYYVQKISSNLFSVETGTSFGCSVAAIPDLDLNGYPELAVGAYNDLEVSFSLCIRYL